MHDIRAITDNIDLFTQEMGRRNLHFPFWISLLDHADKRRRSAIAQMEPLRAQRKIIGVGIAAARKMGDINGDLENLSAELKTQIDRLEQEVEQAEQEAKELALLAPNILDPEVPTGFDEADNIVQHTHGTPRLSNEALQHFELGERLGMDFDAAAKIAGSRFVVLRGQLARLERALGQFMVDLHTAEHGYTETSVPVLVNAQAMRGTGQLPKFEEDLFRLRDGGYYLIPTAEVSLTNLVANDILPADALPLRMTALTDCFRAEAGSAGRDTRGMLRQHQFKKVELVSIVRPEDSDAEHERMTRAAETVLERLGLAYRRMLLCAGDTGFSVAKTYDLEVWLPGQGAWREISSCSNCRAFQARRMAARYRGPDGKPAFVHTLNGSGVAVGRCLIAVMETFQRDGGVDVPEVLWPYMGGVTRITA